MDAIDTQIKDEDLRQQLEEARNLPGYNTLALMLAKTQKSRDEERKLSPIQRRRLQARKLIEVKDIDKEDRQHIHSVLALCGLPYKRPRNDQDAYIREYGRNSLVIQPGYLLDPFTQKMQPQGLPYGPKARLLLFHICTMALRQQSPIIEIADSMSAFIRQLGFSVTGGKKGTITQFKEQLHRLAASRMQIGLFHGDKSSTLNSQPIEAFDIWLPQDPNQKMLWNSTLKLDEKFYKSLVKHALPIDMNVLKAFSQSAKQIDIVLWLAYRLQRLDRVYPITWGKVQEQFGANVTSPRKFKQSFAEDINVVMEVFPALPLKLTEKGITLYPCDAEKLFIASKRKRMKALG